MKLRRVVLAALAVALAGTGCSRYLTAGAALVNGVSISQDEVDRRIVALQRGNTEIPEDQKVEVARQVIGQLIEEELVRQETARRRIAVTPTDVSKRIDELRARFPSAAEFDAALEREQLTLASLGDRVREILNEERLKEQLAGGAEIPEADVREAYEQTKARFQEFRVRQILFQVRDAAGEQTALAKARDAAADLRGGADFAALAARISEDAETKDRGGDLGFRTLDDLTPQIAQTAAQMRVGQISEPVQSPLGYHVFRLEGKRTTPFERVREPIQAQLRQQRLDEALSEWLSTGYRRASIVVNPRYGDWDPRTQRIVPHRFFVPGEPRGEETPFAPVPGAPGGPPPAEEPAG